MGSSHRNRNHPLPRAGETKETEGSPLASGVGEAKSPKSGLPHEAHWVVRAPGACAPNTIPCLFSEADANWVKQ